MNGVAEAPESPTIVRAFAALLAICVIALICAGSAQAQGIDRWEAKPSSTQAGGHPDLQLHVAFGNRASCSGCSDARNLIQQLPTGFIGSPSGLPQCSLAQFATKECPPDTQIGVFGLFDVFGGELGPYTGQEEPVALYSPLYNLPPHPTEAALIGFVAPIIAYTSQIGINARTESDYGLEVSALDTYRVFAPVSVDVWLWGVPALPIHDNARFSNPVNPLCIGRPYDQVNPAGVFGQPGCHPSTPSNAPPIPFLNNPSACGVPLSATIDLTFYNGLFNTAESPWPATTGCDLLSFSPSFDATPTTGQAETASGLEAEINVPQSQSPTVPTPSQIRATRVSLPPGFTLNANAADGKTACTDEEAAFGTERRSQVPGDLEDRHRDSGNDVPARTDPRRHLPRRASSGESLPDLPHRGRLRDPREASRRCPTKPGHRPAGNRVRGPSPGTVPALRAALLRRRAWGAGDPRAVRGIPGEDGIRPLGRRPAESDTRSASSRSTRDRNGGPCPNVATARSHRR